MADWVKLEPEPGKILWANLDQVTTMIHGPTNGFEGTELEFSSGTRVRVSEPVLSIVSKQRLQEELEEIAQKFGVGDAIDA